MSTIPDHLRALVDDAAIFPPAETPLVTAVSAHRRHREAAHEAFVGPFVIAAGRVVELDEECRPDPPTGQRMGVSVVTGAEPAGVQQAVRGVVASQCLRLASLEVRLAPDGDLVDQVRRVATTVASLRSAGELTEDVQVYVEPPRPAAPSDSSWLAALDAIAGQGLRLKLRTGGVVADAFPSEEELAASIEAAFVRRTPFKCTAGLHNAVRHLDADKGFEHHGFLNVLLATAAVHAGGSHRDVVDVLHEPDGRVLSAGIRETGVAALGQARQYFTSFGSCSIMEPLEDLRNLELLPDLHLEPT